MKRPTEFDESEHEPSLGEIAEAAVRKISTALVIAAGAIALAIYARPGPPRYQAFATPTGVVRVDTRTGTLISCVEDRCSRIVRRGQDLERREKAKPLPAPAAPAAPAVPAAPDPARAPAPPAE